MPLRTSLVVVAVALASAAACSSSGPRSGSSPSTAHADTTTAAPSASTSAPAASSNPSTTSTSAGTSPCVLGAGYAPGTARHTLTVDGATRELLVHVPPHPSAGIHLVVDFHGAGSNMLQQDVYSGFDQEADAHGFVVATPNATVVGGVRQWRFLGTHADVDLATAIVAELVEHACVDPAHAAATGISSGGAMTASLACQAADRFRAFAPVAADFYLPSVCAAAPRRPLMIFHGTADPLVPYNGGSAPGGLPVRPAEETAGSWAAHNGCAAGPLSTTIGTQVVRLDWSGCTEPVVMYRIVGGGHTWPGSRIAVTRLGMTTHQIDATDLMWRFFAAYG
jgi:polyhydroxybutyrate depolymerase